MLYKRELTLSFFVQLTKTVFAMAMKVVFFVLIMVLVIGAFIGSAEPIPWPIIFIVAIVVILFLAYQKDE